MKQKITLLFALFFCLSSLSFGQMFQPDMGNKSNQKSELKNGSSISSYTASKVANGSVTYNINTAGQGTCQNPGIDSTFACATDGLGAIVLGVFTDINPNSSQLNSIDLVIYGACSGDVEFFLNGETITSGTATGPTCSCEGIASDPFNPQNYTVIMSPEIQAAFVAGGLNILSVESSNSLAGGQCFYGADVTITTDDAPSVPLSNWAIYISILLMTVVTVFYLRKIFV